METKDTISQDILDSIYCMPISKKKFDEIKKQREILSIVIQLQIRYEMILKNYITLEKEFYSMVLEYNLKICDDDLFLDHRIRINTLFLNLLTAVIPYRDYVIEDAENKLPNIKEHTKDRFSDEEYKFLIGIRNHLQHGRIPHYAIYYGSEVETNKKGNPPITFLDDILLNLDLYLDINNEKAEEYKFLIELRNHLQPEGILHRLIHHASKAKANKEEYKFLMELRNHLQPEGILHRLIHHASKAKANEKEISLIKSGHILLNLDLYVDRNNKKLPIPSIFNDKLEDDQLSLHYVSRYCMDIHNKIHYEIMDLVKTDIQKAKAYIEKTHKNWKKYIKEKIPDNNAEDIKRILYAYAFTIKDNDVPPAQEVALTQTTGYGLCPSFGPHPDLNISKKISLYLGSDDARKTLSEKSRRHLNLLKTKYEL